MALDFGNLDMPVYLQIGDSDRIELGTVTMNIQLGAPSNIDHGPIAGLLHAVADEFAPRGEGDSAASR